jgi:hypothetical protein
MEDESSENTEGQEDHFHNLLMPSDDMNIITIVVENGKTRVDLGEVHPSIALTIFSNIVKNIESILITPTIVYENEVILDPSWYNE